MINQFFKFFSSLRLTVVLLVLAMALVFIGTLAQVKLGLYMAQAEYFRSFFVWWKPNGSSLRIPVFPGGWLLGTLLLVNLIAAHIERFSFSKKKIGIFLTHAGLILLLLGQFLTEIYQIESTMSLKEGESRNFTEDSARNELALIDLSYNSDSNQVVAIPQSWLKPGETISHASLPFSIRVKNFFVNSKAFGPMQAQTNAIHSASGAGAKIGLAPAEKVTSMDDEDKPAALVEVVANDKVIGEWLVSTWFTKYEITDPQTFDFNGHTYEIGLRPTRYYKPYSITLIDFTHDVYPGTQIPKNFSSKVHLSDPTKHEERDVLIYMNNPLRYSGETFYQAGFMQGDSGTILQVVNNPAAVTPYVSCTLVGLGLLTQFLMHLIGFRRKNKTASNGLPDPTISRTKPVSAAPVAERSLR